MQRRINNWFSGEAPEVHRWFAESGAEYEVNDIVQGSALSSKAANSHANNASATSPQTPSVPASQMPRDPWLGEN